MVWGCFGIIIGSIITASSFSMAQITVGRFILGAGIQFMTVAAPAYSMEVAPPQWRGRFTGFYNCGWFGGSIPAALVTFGCQYIDSEWSWRVPFLCQCFACFIVLGAVHFIPESPRYLFANGREAEAIDFLTEYHGGGNRNARLVLLEIEEIQESIRQELNDKKIPWWDFSCLFKTKEARWRSSQVLMMGVFGQFSGNGLGYFNATIFGELGVKSVAQQLGYNVLNSVISAIGAGTAVSQTDRMPRRKVLVYGTFACAVMLAINGGCNVAFGRDQTNINAGQSALAFYFLFNVVNSFTYTPLQGVVPVEALDNTRRAKGLAFYGFLTGCLGFINTFCTPIANKTIGLNYIWVFVGWDCIETVCWYFFGYVNLFCPIYYACTLGNRSLLNIPPVSRPKAALSRSSSGSTNSRTQSRHLNMSTESYSRPTAPSPRRSSAKTTLRLADSCFCFSIKSQSRILT